MNLRRALALLLLAGIATVGLNDSFVSQNPPPPSTENKSISESDCSVEKLGSSIPVNAIGEPVSAVTLAAPRWVAAGTTPAYCSIDGVIAPVDKSAYGSPIN